jgi:hypothetical protein
MRTLLSLLLAALLALLPAQAAQAATSATSTAPSPARNLSETYALAIEGASFRNGSVFNPDLMQNLRACPICPNGRVVCPPQRCR